MKPKEILQFETLPEVVWLHGLDLLEHILQGDTEQTFFRSTMDHKDLLEQLQEELQKVEEDKFQEINEELGKRKAQFIEFKDEEGDFDPEAYIEGDDFVFIEEEKQHQQGKGLNLFIDLSIPWHDRTKKDMQKRHEQVYSLALERESYNYPTRVIAAYSAKIMEKENPIKVFVVLKDYDDPIFPGLWGGLKNNKTGNCFLNCIQNYFIGTGSMGNGHIERISLSKIVQDEEFSIIEPRTGFLKE